VVFLQSEGEIEYQLITTDEYEMSNAVIEERKAVIKSVKGKMTLHAISTDNHRNLKRIRVPFGDATNYITCTLSMADSK
jgi:hypothetical protein